MAASETFIIVSPFKNQSSSGGMTKKELVIVFFLAGFSIICERLEKGHQLRDRLIRGCATAFLSIDRKLIDDGIRISANRRKATQIVTSLMVLCYVCV